MHLLRRVATEVASIPDFLVKGKICGVKGLIVSVVGLNNFAAIGSRCEIKSKNGLPAIEAEVVALLPDQIMLMPFVDITGIAIGDEVMMKDATQVIYPDIKWLGRIINALGKPIDCKGPLAIGDKAYNIKSPPPPARLRTRVGGKLDTGIKAINAFLSICDGQRLGVFAGSGVGKSMLIAMLAKYATNDVKVIGLIGERGREVQEFIEDYLGEEGLKQSVIIVATSDESAVLRKQAAYLTMSVAEYFSKQGKSVLCMMDSVTRFAMAIREIGLAIGEPPTTKGYTPTVFAELPKLLERSGPMPEGNGAITGLFSVLVEGDDHNEPVADAVRGIIDGHIVLSRQIATRRYPAIDILQSVSRMIPKCNNNYENQLINRARMLIANHEEMADMIRIGAYRHGSDPLIDEAIKYQPKIEEFLRQGPNDKESLEASYLKLAKSIEYPLNSVS